MIVKLRYQIYFKALFATRTYEVSYFFFFFPRYYKNELYITNVLVEKTYPIELNSRSICICNIKNIYSRILNTRDGFETVRSWFS